MSAKDRERITVPRRPVQYDVLLRIRKLQEDLRAQSLAEARREVKTAEALRDSLIEQRHSILETASARARERFDPREVALYYQYERFLSRLRDEKEAEIDQLRGIEEVRRSELEDAMKRRRIIEKLRERKWKAFDVGVLKEEQKLSDETATNAVARIRILERRVTGSAAD